ncbi:hypothetical protein [Rhodosalinus sp. 5P4]|uniref:hypothetical protein n=1 Tax=Rhodosalinus sp. 5P4 TaxID=3239196 RepID=UPI003523CAA7
MSTKGFSRRLTQIRKLRSAAPGWAKMAEFRTRQTSDGKDDATCAWDKDRVVVKVGNRSFFIRSDAVCKAPEIWDFALFGLAAISSRTNRTIRVDAPVSAAAARMVETLNYAYTLWSIPSLSPPRLILENIVDAGSVSRRKDHKVICLSGGVDSTSSAVAAKAEAEYSHSLLVAGADYPTADHPGFIDLRSRVERISDIIGLDLIVAETDFRNMPMHWELQHSFILAMCLNYIGKEFCEASYALDLPPIHDVFQHPWGNSSILMDIFGRGDLPLVAFGHTLRRGERVRAIHDADPELVRQLSVCWRDTSTGGNCGKCLKCVRTRDMLHCAGIPDIGLFECDSQEIPGLDDGIPRDYDVRMAIVTYMDWATTPGLKDDRRQQLQQRIEKLRESYVRQMPYR